APLLRDTKWADGLRGIAAFFVVSSHLTLGYVAWLDHPTRTKDTRLAFYNLPFIRVFAQGSPWVITFLVLTGFVNAIKPIKQGRAGRVDAALSGLASSCFRRSARLVLPCTIATFFSWIICEAGGYKIGNMVESAWMVDTSPLPSTSIQGAICRLLSSIYTTWATGRNVLDKNQWAMIFFLKGSLALYVLLLATVRATARYRMLIFFVMIMFSWAKKDTHMGLPIYSGALLTEVSMIPGIINFSVNRRLVYRLPPFFMVVFAWYLISYPVNKPSWQPWSNALWTLGKLIFPKGAEYESFFYTIAIALLVFSIILSAKLQQIFSHPVLLWLGAHSFPIYLIHGPLLRSFLNWVLYAFVAPTLYQEKDDKGNVVRQYERFPIPSALKFFLLLPVFYAVLFVLAHFWLQKIEPRCASATKWLE
ncbi:hypothetical protein BU16DRAFT_424020, partial [Lophium mytilinum]